MSRSNLTHLLSAAPPPCRRPAVANAARRRRSSPRFLGGTPVLALARRRDPLRRHAAKRVAAHPRTPQSSSRGADGKRLVTGGDDGRVVATDADGRDERNRRRKRQVDRRPRAARRRRGRVVRRQARCARATPRASSRAGRAVRARAASPSCPRATGSPSPITTARRCGFPMPRDAGVAGMEGLASRRHLVAGRQVSASPRCRRTCCTAGASPTGSNMRMSGYPAKTRSFSWSHDGEWLATSGADACVVWPFQTKDGPMGKPPRECGVRPQKVSRVAFHPRALVLAVGYEDGWMLLVPPRRRRRASRAQGPGRRRNPAARQAGRVGAVMGQGRPPPAVRASERRGRIADPAAGSAEKVMEASPSPARGRRWRCEAASDEGVAAAALRPGLRCANHRSPRAGEGEDGPNPPCRAR